jgi:hypothetical protein
MTSDDYPSRRHSLSTKPTSNKRHSRASAQGQPKRKLHHRGKLRNVLPVLLQRPFYQTALVVLALDPATAWDRSFLLSAAAMAGVLFIGLPLASRTYAASTKRSIPLRAVFQLLLAPAPISLGAVAGSLPLVAFNFGQVSLLSIPATLIAMPLVPPLLISGLLTGAAGLIFSPLASILGLLAAILGALLVAIAELIASAPGATIETTRGRPLGLDRLRAHGHRRSHDLSPTLAPQRGRHPQRRLAWPHRPPANRCHARERRPHRRIALVGDRVQPRR